MNTKNSLCQIVLGVYTLKLIAPASFWPELYKTKKLNVSLANSDTVVQYSMQTAAISFVK